MEITTQQMFTWIMVSLVLLQSFSTVYTARKNAKSLMDEKKAPLKALEERMSKCEAKLGNDYLRFERTDRELADNKAGISVICQGILALLNHELHNGNADEMQEALRRLNSWMLGR